MKKYLLITFCPFYLFAQLNDDFQNLDNWTGDTYKFEIDSLGQLHLSAQALTDKAIIWRNSKALINGLWQIDVTMDFNPSSTNYTQIHLSSDSVANGYFIKLGGANDEVNLYKRQDSQSIKLIDGSDDLLDLDSVALSLLVERDSLGLWQLSIKRISDNDFLFQGQCFDDSYLTSQQFGIECVYTKTRSDKFYFDNLRVEGYSFVDTFLYPQANDIVINEVLFNPIDGDNDFVEIINRSDKTLCLKNLQLGNYYANAPANFKSITDSYNFLKPQEILVLCLSKETLLHYHPLALEYRIIELESMPSYNNDMGAVVLSLDSTIIDEFHYDEGMHFDLLTDVEGVSLERISTEINSINNWHSAAEQDGFSTPTLVNSQAQLLLTPQEIMTLSPAIISPNNDGVNDLLSIQLQFNTSGYRGRILIFNPQGFLIKTLVNNALFGTSDIFFWDGTTDRNEVAKAGLYIVWLEATHPQYSSVLEKQTTVVGRE
ncbi:MAG: lamin tail domain-containing protein [Flavobacteriales bacterium]|nr:lamin tail domain-containing protein [Flavobacteriales bacterium]